MYKLEIKKEMKKIDESQEFKNDEIEYISELFIDETVEKLEIKVNNKIDYSRRNDPMRDLEYIFEDFKFDKNNLELTNTPELIQQWKKIKKANIFENQDKEATSLIINFSKYYENEKTLSNVIKSYSFMPFLLFFYKHKDLDGIEEVVKVSSVMHDEKIYFKMKLEKGKEENEYIISSKLDSKFDLVTYRGELRKKLQVPLSKVCTFNIELSGKYIYSDRLESMEIEMKIFALGIMEYKKTINITEVGINN